MWAGSVWVQMVRLERVMVVCARARVGWVAVSLLLYCTGGLSLHRRGLVCSSGVHRVVRSVGVVVYTHTHTHTHTHMYTYTLVYLCAY